MAHATRLKIPRKNNVSVRRVVWNGGSANGSQVGSKLLTWPKRQ